MKQKLAALLAAVCLLCAAVTGCGDDGTGGGFRFLIDAEPKGLDPQMTTDTPAVTVMSALFEGLTRLDGDGNPIPAAADWTVSEDALTYTFTLKEAYWTTLSVKGEETPFDNPTPVTAADFAFGMGRVLDPATGSPLATELYGIKNAKAVHTGKKKLSALGVKAVDARTLTITLEQPDDGFLAKLASTPYMPCNQAFFEYTGGRYGLEVKHLITNGPFRLAAWNHDESLLLYKNEDYHAAAEIAPEAVRFVIGSENPAEDLQTGNLDAAPLTVAEATRLQNSLTVQPLMDSVRCLWLNTADGYLYDANLRQALRDSIEWDTVREYLSTLPTNPETPADGFIPPEATVGGEDYRREENRLTPKTNAKSARKAMNAGLADLYPNGTGKLRPELIAADDGQSADLARYIVQSWQKNLGIAPTLTLLPQAELESRVKSGNFQAAIYTYVPAGLTGAENLCCFLPGAADNFTSLNSKAVTGAVNAALKGGREELEQAERAVYDACVCLPLSYPARYYGFYPDVEGILLRPFGGGRFCSPLEFRSAKKYE